MMMDLALLKQTSKESDWSMVPMEVTWEHLNLITMEHGAQFVIDSGRSLMPELHAGRQNHVVMHAHKYTLYYVDYSL